MHVRYLQHSSHGHVQLLLMPLMSNTVAGDSFHEPKGRTTEEGADSEPVPLPIQSFLWRQTHPFLGARVSKLQDASCVTFERVIVQNILHGISPSLSDAIGSISRWNFVRASFPHIIQCCSALLTERVAEEEGLAMSGSLVKMLYILHWLLIDAAVECNENSLTSEIPTANVLSVRQLTYSVPSIQLFVYLLAPLFGVVREEEIEGHIRLESGHRLWQALWQQQLPELLCFSAPVKQRRNQLPQLNLSTPWAKRVQSTAAEQGIYVGDNKGGAAPAASAAVPLAPVRRPSQIPAAKASTAVDIPPPKPPRSDANVLREMQLKKQMEQGSQPDGMAEQAPKQGNELAAGSGGGGIVRSVSDYCSQRLRYGHGDYKSAAIAEQSRAIMRKSRTATFQQQPSASSFAQSPDSPADDFSGIKCMDEMFRDEEDGFSAFDPSLNSQPISGAMAPLVQLKDICSTASIDNESVATVDGQDDNGAVDLRTESAQKMAGDESQRTPVAVATAARNVPKMLVCSPSGEDSASVSSQQTVIAVRSATTSTLAAAQQQQPPSTAAPQARPPQIAFVAKSESEMSTDKEKPETPPSASTDPHEANYLDVAVIRSLLIRNWAEEGIFWAVRYLLNRLLAMRQFRGSHEGTFRSRCNSDSAAIPVRKTSKNEATNLDSRGYLTWAELQYRTDTFGKRLVDRQHQMTAIEPRAVVFGGVEQSAAELLAPDGEGKDRRRRISVNTLPSKPTKKLSRTDAGGLHRPVRRCRSEPALLPRLTELLSFSSSDPSNSLPIQQPQQEPPPAGRKASHFFFPEATGSGAFIDRNGHICMPVVLRVLGTLMERCAVVRVSEVVLNICDTLVNMPGTDQGVFFPGLLHVIHRVCLQLGCPNGCNEGVRTPQAEFIRVKLRNLIAQMHRINPKRLAELLSKQVAQIGIGPMVDALHSLTIFCQTSPAFSRVQQRSSRLASQHQPPWARRNSPSLRVVKPPTYKNNFNEAKSGVEGVLVGAMLGPLLSKLANNAAELNQPENMSLAQDVRLLVAYATEKHGNPLRRCALSAMAAKTVPSREGAAGAVSSAGEPASIKNVASNPTLAPPQRDNAASLRRGLFRKKEWMQTTLTNEQTGEEGAGAAGVGSNHSTPPSQLNPSASVDDSIGSPQQHLPVKKGKSSAASRSGGGRLQFALNLLKGTRPSTGSEAVNSEEDDGSSNAADEQQPGLAEDEGSLGGSSIDASSGRGKLGGLRVAAMASSRLTPRGQQQFGTEADERADSATPTLVPSFLPPRKLVQIKELRDGATRFAFLLENSRPGNFPDAPLVAALAELKSPVLSRAVLLLECLHFVNRCNRGDWPDWIRSGMSIPGRALAGSGGGHASHPTSIHPQSSMRIGGMGGGGGASRRTAILQRALGRAFYNWASQLGIRLQRQIDAEAERGGDRRQLKLFDELEDFLDDGTVNIAAKGDGTPIALQLIVCALLHQITAFLRETFQSLPRNRQLSQKNANAITSGWEKLQSHRRWSILSNTFNPQVQQMAQQQPLGSGSIHSINELHPERRISYSTADEENSPRGSHDMAGEEQQSMDKAAKEALGPAPSVSSSLGSTLRRFASRTLFSRLEYFPLGQNEEVETAAEPAAATADEHFGLDEEKPLLVEKSPAAEKSSIRSHSRSGRSSRSVRRLAQGRQRLLKRSSPSAPSAAGISSSVQTPPPSASDSIGGIHNFRESFRNRKISKTTAAPTFTAISMESGAADAAGGSSSVEGGISESMPLMRRATADLPPVEPIQQRLVSFVQRRRRTTSFKSRLSRSMNARHMSMRAGRMSVDQQDLEAAAHPPPGEDEAAEVLSSQPITPTPTLNSQGSRSPIFMLSIAQKANPGSRLKPSFIEQPQQQQQPMPSPERLSSSTGASIQQMQMEQAEEENEEEMLKSMPWLKTLLEFSQRLDFACSHEHYCSKWCFERISRQSYRLVDALLVVYGQVDPEKRVDRRQQFIERWQSGQQDTRKRHSSNPPRRESANVRQSGVDRMPLALRGLIIEKLNEIEESKAKKAEEVDMAVDPKELRCIQPPPIVNILRTQLLGLVHAPLSALLKGMVVLKAELLIPAVPIAWALLNRSDDANLTATAAALFICCAVKCPQESTAVLVADLASTDPTVRTSAVRRFFVLWRQRFHVWLKMEEGAQLVFKVPPPSIDFTLPSPSIGQSQVPVVDPPWMPPIKTKVEELSLKEEEHSTSQTIMTMTRTRRKQKQEMVRKAVRRAEERQRELRELFLLRATAVVQQAAYEPALFQHQLMAQGDMGGQAGEESALAEPIGRQMIIPVAQPLFPSSVLSVVPTIVELLDDPQVDNNGVTVSEMCRNVIWSCLVEDTALFLRHFFEKFTNRAKQEQMMALLRRLVLTFRPLPPQTAHTLLNALLGLVMFYVRTPGEGSDRSLGLALSLCWLVVPFVHGLYFKDLKQTLKKEQCDQAIMITANVPSAKKVIVHGPDSHQGGIPTQFPVLEETLFQHLLADSLDFYNIDQAEADSHFLYDPKTLVLHNPSAYVRDFYFFHRSFYPQLQLIRLDPGLAQQRIREHAFQQKLIETGKVLLTHNALRFSPEAVVPQRIFFLHDEFTHLPSFPRRAVESCFGMYQGKGGEQLQTMDALHKFAWSKLMANMFEKMENVFMFGDLHLFINVINGVMIIHCEDVLILRRCMAAYLSMSIHFQSLFASQGFFLIMPTILRCYSQRQPNRLFTQVVEFVCKQFYVLHRKPFLLQMFGSVADILDQSESDLEASPMRVKAKYLFSLLLAMERMMEPLDQLHILSMLPYPKPLQALDLCYKDEPNTFTILTDAMASCVTICAFAPESRRSHQMLTALQSMLPHLLQHMEEESVLVQTNSSAALKHEMAAFSTLGVEMRALVNSCDVLARGPTRSFDFLPSHGPAAAASHEFRGRSFLGPERADSPQFFDPPTIVEDDPSRQQPIGGGGQSHSSAGGPGTNRVEKKITAAGWADGTAAADIELQKEQFRGPRDALLTLSAMFVRLGSARLKELGKLASGLEHTRMPELLDHKCHVKLMEIAVSLLKLAPYDPNTLACSGLRHYFVHMLPIVDWSVETNRSAINVILRRLDKTIAKIAKRPSSRRRANWNAVSAWLGGLHQTLLNSPYIAHLHSLKTITLLCLRLSLGDSLGPSEEPTGSQQPHISQPAIPHTVLSPHLPPAPFCSIVLKLTSFLMTTLGQLVFSLELICTSESLGPLAERPEAMLCLFLIPMFLRAAIPGKESPQFQIRDLSFCLGLLQNAICPPLAAKQSVVPAVSGSSLTTALIRDTTGAGRQGSVSVTDKGYSATVSTTRIVRDSVALAAMLAIKTIVVCFQKQLTVPHWLRVARIVREMVAKKCGGPALGPFLKFLLGASLPIGEMLQPIVHSKLNQRPANDGDAAWQAELREKVARLRSCQPQTAAAERKGHHFGQMRALHRELLLLREDFASRNLEIPRSHTPTIGGELHSDSGSSQGTGVRESRRLSSSTALGKLRWIQIRGGGGGGEDRGAKSSLPNQQTVQLDDTIPEDAAAEEENANAAAASGAGGGGQRVNKSPSLPFSRGSMRHQSLAMFRSVRRKPARLTASAEAAMPGGSGGNAARTGRYGGVEMREVGPELGSRIGRSSLKRPNVGPRPSQPREEEATAAGTSEAGDPSTPSQSSLAFGGSTEDRPRVVSFSTPRHSSSVSQTISEADTEAEFCITSTKHLI